MKSQPTRGRPPILSTETIVDAAAEIGLADLSLTSVAARLGVGVSSLYGHVAGRDDLAQRLADRLVAGFELPRRDGDVTSVLLGFGERLYDFLSAHPGLAAQLDERSPPSLRTKADELVAMIVGHGWEPAVAALASWDIESFVATYVGSETRGPAIEPPQPTKSPTSPAEDALQTKLKDTTNHDLFCWTLRFHVRGLVDTIERDDLPWATPT